MKWSTSYIFVLALTIVVAPWLSFDGWREWGKKEKGMVGGRGREGREGSFCYQSIKEKRSIRS